MTKPEIKNPIAKTILELLREYSELPIWQLYHKLRLHGFRDENEIEKTLRALHGEGKIQIMRAWVYET